MNDLVSQKCGESDDHNNVWLVSFILSNCGRFRRITPCRRMEIVLISSRDMYHTCASVLTVTDYNLVAHYVAASRYAGENRTAHKLAIGN